MRITQAILLKNARNLVFERSARDRTLVCIYLTGSILAEDTMLLGGATDIDLIFIHDGPPPAPREVLRLTDDVHIDIAHLAQQTFINPRRLRADPWLGSFLCKDPLMLHDKNHWFEFTQASVAAQFYQPEHIARRVRYFLDDSRRQWFELQSAETQPDRWPPALALAYLQVLEKAANAAAVLEGAPLTERRFLLQFNERSKALGKPALLEKLIALFAPALPEGSDWAHWIENWKTTYDAAGKLANCPPRLHPCRRDYYARAALALSEEFPAAALWVLLRSWTMAAATLPDGDPALQPWVEACTRLQLDPAHFEGQVEALDSYLDMVEEIVEQWAADRGIDIQKDLV